MACGCSTTTATMKDRAAICHLCIHADRRGDLEVLGCTVNGRAIAPLVKDGGCPMGKYPVNGVVRWCGLDWYGVPYPVRLALWVQHEKHPRPDSFSGCGCIKRLKDWWATMFVRTNKGTSHAD